MKKANFDTLKNLPVPEKWIENALAIPEQEKKKAAVIPFWRRKGAVALAASLVLVSVLGVILFSQIGTKPPLKISPTATETLFPTEMIGDSSADPTPEESTEPKSIIDTVKDAIDSIFRTPTETQVSGSTKPTTAFNNKTNNPTEPQAQSPTEKAGTRPTESAKPSEAPDPTQGAKATETPAYPTAPQRETEAPTEAERLDPTYAPDYTLPAREDPTYAPDHTGPAWDPSTATEPNVRPTTDPNEDYYVSSLIAVVSKRSLPQNTIYCKVYDENWVLCGDENLYSAQHVAQVIDSGNKYTLSYTPSDFGIIPKRGYYFYQFYDANGWKSIVGGDFVNAS